MDKLLICAKAFNKLTGIQYHIIAGRKGKTVDITIGFKRSEFHHLMGLGKLKDLRISSQNREKVFQDIMAGKISYRSISKSNKISSIENRFAPLSNLESLLDSNELIFRYYERNNSFSIIQADYLLVTPFSKNDVYIFIAKKEENDLYYCRSFFPKENMDYTKNQARYTLLFKEKIMIDSGEKIIQYNKLM